MKYRTSPKSPSHSSSHISNRNMMEEWWTRNVKVIEKCDIKSAGHACVTRLPRHGKFEESKIGIKNCWQRATAKESIPCPPRPDSSTSCVFSVCSLHRRT
ncbi:hypothetical protein BS17DRAFT_777093 [Gyrodon lividus]|nr:hypothetical protein BS17DRAFT_777093 [Gyrodon lividus]